MAIWAWDIIGRSFHMNRRCNSYIGLRHEFLAAKFCGVLLVMVTMASFPAKAQLSPNLVADGDFENGIDLSPWWSVAGAAGGYPRIDNYPPYAHTGSNYADVGGGANSIYQSLATTSGATYD